MFNRPLTKRQVTYPLQSMGYTMGLSCDHSGFFLHMYIYIYIYMHGIHTLKLLMRLKRTFPAWKERGFG